MVNSTTSRIAVAVAVLSVASSAMAVPVRPAGNSASHRGNNANAATDASRALSATPVPTDYGVYPTVATALPRDPTGTGVSSGTAPTETPKGHGHKKGQQQHKKPGEHPHKKPGHQQQPQQPGHQPHKKPGQQPHKPGKQPKHKHAGTATHGPNHGDQGSTSTPTHTTKHGHQPTATATRSAHRHHGHQPSSLPTHIGIPTPFPTPYHGMYPRPEFERPTIAREFSGDLDERDLEDDLEVRNLEDGLEVRDSEEDLELRDYEDDLEARGYIPVSELEARTPHKQEKKHRHGSKHRGGKHMPFLPGMPPHFPDMPMSKIPMDMPKMPGGFIHGQPTSPDPVRNPDVPIAGAPNPDAAPVGRAFEDVEVRDFDDDMEMEARDFDVEDVEAREWYDDID